MMYLQWNVLATESLGFWLLWSADVMLASKQKFADAGTHYAMCNPL